MSLGLLINGGSFEQSASANNAAALKKNTTDLLEE